ncbi:MAG: hypothetical protein N4A33_12895 [Bacteriovoracaceae bacterium]|jgi:hypothetical protein|nr:hypothetical protein [Bacteriovoracaceae bacterium]
MKKLLIIMLLCTSAFSYDFDWKKWESWKKLVKEDLNYFGSAGFGQVEIDIDNKFNSNYVFNYFSVSGGASFDITQTYTIFAILNLKKFTTLDFEQDGLSGSKSVSSIYNDLYFGISKNVDDFKFTVGYDNLNYFVPSKSTVIKSTRIDRASIQADYLNFYDRFTPSVKVGMFVPVFEQVFGFDINLSMKYDLTEDEDKALSAYLYRAALDLDSDDATSTSFGLNYIHRF